MRGFLPTLPEIGLEEIRDALAAKQEWMKNNHDSKLANKAEPEIFPIGALVIVQKEDGGPWTHGTIINHNKEDHHMQSYRIKLSLSGCVITRNTKHIRETSIMPWMYRKIEKIKQTENDPDRQDEKPTTKPDRILPTDKVVSTPPQAVGAPKVDLTPKPVKPAVRKAETNCELPKTVKTSYGRVVKPPNHLVV